MSVWFIETNIDWQLNKGIPFSTDFVLALLNVDFILSIFRIPGPTFSLYTLNYT